MEVFSTERDNLTFENAVGETLPPDPIRTLDFCLMPVHRVWRSRRHAHGPAGNLISIVPLASLEPMH